MKEDWDLMVRQEIEFEESFLNMEQSVIETDTDNIILKQVKKTTGDKLIYV